MTKLLDRTLLVVAWQALSWAAFGASNDPESAVSNPIGPVRGGSLVVAGRPWTPRDSVVTRYFFPETLSVSPDGAYFFFVTVHGDLSCDCEVWELSVYATEDVRRALAHGPASQGSPVSPLRTLRRVSGGGTYTFAIWDPHWERDGTSISFEDASEKGGQQLYLFEVRSGVLTALTHNAYEMDSIQRMGDTIISNLLVPVPDAAPGYPAHVITKSELQEMMLPAGSRRKITTFVSYRGRPPWEITSTDFLNSAYLWFSADGRRALTLRLPKAAPASWATYEKLQGLSDYGISVTDFSRFELIDAEHGRSEPLFDAPTGLATSVGEQEWRRGVYEQALWATDQRHVILVNTALPIVAGRDPERRSMSYIVGYNVESGQWAEIEPLASQERSGGALRTVVQVGWLALGKELLVRHTVAGRPAAGTVYTLSGDRWVGHEVASTVKLPEPPKPRGLDGRLSVTLRQSANDPPIVVASDGHHQLAVTAPDPALQGVWLARQEPFQWREPSGRLETGGLLLPRDRDARSKLPLVIQAYEYSADEFNPDGMDHDTYAAQALVAHGIAVLNVDIPAVGAPPHELGTPREVTEFSERVTSAAQALAERGLIDLARVGLIGFSRAGFNTYYVITHPGQNPPAAAVIDDGFSGTYNTYLDAEATSTLGRVAWEPLYGGDFWHHKAAWLEREASFNIDHVQTPTLFTIHSRDSLPHAAATIGAFQLNDRPLEYLLYPMAHHQLHLPRQRLASYEATVDWMSFWLQGYEDPSPQKVDQYKRWRVTKANWEKQKAWEAAGHPSGSPPDAGWQPPENKKN